MNASDMTFGIEIETIAPQSAIENDGLRIGAYHHGIQVPYLPEGWRAERDGSIDASRIPGGQACEIVSPVLRGAEGLAQVAGVVKTLETKGHKVNITCGVHVQVGWSRELPAEALTDNWLELTVRFLARTHGVRELKDAISRDILAGLDAAGIGIASATVEVVGVPELRIQRSGPYNQPRSGSSMPA